jgi:diaminopimelate epimerase
MMSEITFHKMEASGNDFLVIDNRKGAVKDPKRFALDVCRPHVGVGADGVLLIEPSKKGDFFMRIVNADGSEAEACGNGYRCVGLYAKNILGLSESIRMDTPAGLIDVHVNAKTIKAKMTDPKDYREQIKIDLGEKNLTGAFLNTGVPHVVIFAEGLNQTPVTELGRAIRHHELFQPRGVNVNFAEMAGPNALAIRTYERGVEAETLACGTGTVAVALVAALTGRAEGPVQVKTKSGEILTVYFERSGQSIRNVFLEGNARFVFEGRLQWN